MDFSNDPELDGKYLGTITGDFIKITDTLKEASYQLRVRKISDHPIFPISKQFLKVGQLLIGKDEADLQWNFNFSFLENIVGYDIVEEDKIEDFLSTYKDPDEFACLLVIDNEFMNFIYIPYPED